MCTCAWRQGGGLLHLWLCAVGKTAAMSIASFKLYNDQVKRTVLPKLRHIHVSHLWFIIRQDCNT
jgi:hypothetical protein